MKALPQLMIEHIGFKADGRFVEVGAFDGKKWSNTWELAELGWRGLMFEPNPEQFCQCVKNHSEHEVIVLPIAISDRTGTTELYLGGSLSTIRPEMVDIYGSMGWSRSTGLGDGRSIVVPTTTLDLVLDECGWDPEFELLVIDVEGAEMQVLDAFDISRWAPEMIVIETHEMYPDKKISYKAGAILGRLDFHGYIHVHGDTINSVLVRK